MTLDAGQWERLPDQLGIDPALHAESAGILAEVRRVVDDELTAHQRRIFVAIVLDGIPLDALAARLGLRRNAMGMRRSATRASLLTCWPAALR